MTEFKRRPMRIAMVLGGGAAVVAGAVITFNALNAAQAVTGPIARYDMRAGTSSGFGAMGMGGGGGGGFGRGMAMAFGGGGRGGPNHELTLELGSNDAPPASAGPKADHFMPAGARLGLSVPLITPEPVKIAPGKPEEPQEREFKRPKGRMLIFWGCGEHAGPGQPVVIDFAKMAAGQMPTGLFSGSVPMDRWVRIGSMRTTGFWPNSVDRKTVQSDSSLIGAHRVAANYAPEMNFNLQHDFMAPLSVNSPSTPSGAIAMQWNAIADATGYYAFAMGGNGGDRSGQMQDLVWWSSSATREFGGGLSDWLSPGTVARLVAQRVVIAPQTNTCTIPAEVKQAAPQFLMTTLYAYGPEEDFTYPARPADPRQVWHIQWQARIRHRSMTSFMPGMPGMDGSARGGRNSEQSQQQGQPCQPKKHHGFGGLGGLVGGIVGGGGGGDGC